MTETLCPTGRNDVAHAADSGPKHPTDQPLRCVSGALTPRIRILSRPRQLADSGAALRSVVN